MESLCFAEDSRSQRIKRFLDLEASYNGSFSCAQSSAHRLGSFRPCGRVRSPHSSLFLSHPPFFPATLIVVTYIGANQRCVESWCVRVVVRWQPYRERMKKLGRASVNTRTKALLFFGRLRPLLAKVRFPTLCGLLVDAYPLISD